MVTLGILSERLVTLGILPDSFKEFPRSSVHVLVPEIIKTQASIPNRYNCHVNSDALLKRRGNELLKDSSHLSDSTISENLGIPANLRALIRTCQRVGDIPEMFSTFKIKDKPKSVCHGCVLVRMGASNSK